MSQLVHKDIASCEAGHIINRRAPAHVFRNGLRSVPIRDNEPPWFGLSIAACVRSGRRPARVACRMLASQPSNGRFARAIPAIMPPSFPFLPPRLAGLADVACNLSWTWNSDARMLFRALDEQLWKRYRYDPLRVLDEVGAERLEQCSADPRFLTLYDSVMRWFESERSSDLTWFARTHPDLRHRPIAYFCAEFGIYHSVPIYSGGLGVLAGDHCKTASDLGVPLVGVGILYRDGYFDQRVRLDGWQEDMDDHFDPFRTPLEPIAGPNGEPFLTKVPTFGDRKSVV